MERADLSRSRQDSEPVTGDTVRVNGINLACQVHGAGHRPVLLMIQGLGMPLSAWPPKLIRQLVDRGFRVVLFDNRDAGHSQTLDHLGVPDVRALYWRRLVGMRLTAPYRLEDMADDAQGLMDALDIQRAHVVGISMGGMIAQCLAIRAQHRIETLTSWMSTTGDHWLQGPRWRVALHLLSRPRGADLRSRIEFGCRTWRLLGSPGYPTSDEQIRETVQRIYSRPMTEGGVARQIAAIIAAPGRSGELARVTVPTLVIHGDADPLVRLSGGLATAKAIPNARLHVIPGFGHDLPPQLHGTFTELIADHARGMAPR